MTGAANLVPPAGAAWPPTFERYELHEHLGDGGMGSVYKATDRELGRTVALKMPLPELAANARIFDLFRHEARMVAQLDHQNICHVWDVGRERDIPFLAMEFVDGDELSARRPNGDLLWEPRGAAELVKTL